MLIKRVNRKRNYALDINIKQCSGILVIKLKLHRVCPQGETWESKPEGCPEEVRGSWCGPPACGVVPVYMWGINVSTHCLTEEIQL